MISSFPLSSRVDEFVELYEDAWSRDGDADPVDFLPRRDDPDYLAVAAELLRVDFERRWQAGQHRLV